MKPNMGGLDRIVRIVVAALAVVLYFTGTLTGTVGIVAMALAAVFLLTGLISFCPLYSIFGLSTCSIKK
jgi:hypothetical protein